MRERASTSLQWLAWRGIIAIKLGSAAKNAGFRRCSKRAALGARRYISRGTQPRSEMTQSWRLLDQFQSAYSCTPAPHIQNYLDGIIDMALRINAAWNRQPHQIHIRVVAEHQGANFHGTDSAFDIKFASQSDTGKLRGRNVRQECASVNVDGVSTRRLHDRHTGVSDMLAEIRRGSDAVIQIILFERFVQ